MGRLRYNVAATLDGFIASRDHSTDWIVDDSTIDFTSLYAEFSSFVMGRKTYETMLTFGDQNPLQGRPRETVVVVSRQPETAEKYPDVTVVSEDVVDYVKKLKTQGEGKDVWFMGGAGLAGLMLEEGVMDGVEVAIMPVVIGEGVKMIDSSGVQSSSTKRAWKLKLVSVEKKETGIVMTKYEVVYVD